MISGPPGAGKSTVARVVAEASSPSVLVEGDAFFGFLASGAIEPWRPESHAQNTVVTEVAGGAAGRFALGGFHTVYDGILGPWFLDTFAEATGTDDRLDYAILLPPLERCLERVRSRIGHEFTDEDATIHMHAQFADAVGADGVAARHVITSDLETAADVAVEVLARQASGELRVTRSR